VRRPPHLRVLVKIAGSCPGERVDLAGARSCLLVDTGRYPNSISEKRVDNARAAVLYLGGVGAIAAAMTATVLRTSGLPQVVVPTVGAVCLAVATFVAATPAEFLLRSGGQGCRDPPPAVECGCAGRPDETSAIHQDRPRPQILPHDR